MIAAGILLVAFIFLKKEEDTSVPKTAVEETMTTEESIVPVPRNEDEETEEEAMKLSLRVDDLPTMKDMQDLTEEELHSTPIVVTKAGESIGLLIEDADKNPEKQEATLKLLLSCSENKDVVPAIRALCWKKTLVQMPVWNKPVPLSEYDVPLEIKLLGEKLD